MQGWRICESRAKFTSVPGRYDISSNIHCMGVVEGIANALAERPLVIRMVRTK